MLSTACCCSSGVPCNPNASISTRLSADPQQLTYRQLMSSLETHRLRTGACAHMRLQHKATRSHSCRTTTSPWQTDQMSKEMSCPKQCRWPKGNQLSEATLDPTLVAHQSDFPNGLGLVHANLVGPAKLGTSLGELKFSWVADHC